MNNIENISKPTGFIRIQKHVHGKLVEETFEKNLVVDLLHFVQAMYFKGDLTNTDEIYMSWGSGTTPATASNTKLEDEQYRSLVVRDYDTVDPSIIVLPGGSGVTNCVSFTAIVPEGVEIKITEYGLFGGPGASATKDTGLLMSRKVSPENNKVSDSVITFTWLYFFEN